MTKSRDKRAGALAIVHESDGHPYFAALDAAARMGGLRVRYYELRWFRNLMKDIVRGRILRGLRRALANAQFFCVGVYDAETRFLVGAAPYDWRILLVSRLSRHAAVVYHTSWVYWHNKPAYRPAYLGAHVRKLWARFIGRKNTAVVAVTAAAADSFRAVFPDKPVTVIPHTVDLPGVGTRNENPEDQPLRVVYVGRLVREKGLETIVAARTSSEWGMWSLSIVGSGRDRPLLDPIESLPHVSMLGKVQSRQRLRHILATSDVLVQPSIACARWEELFGISIVEGMAAGLCVIASRHAGPASIITDGVNGFLSRGLNLTARELTNLLQRLSVDRQLLRRISGRAARDARAYAIDRVKSQWAVVLRDA